MKKILLSCMVLLGMTEAAYAEDVKVLVPDQEFTSVAAIGDNSFAIVNLAEEKGLFNPDAQNLKYDVYSKAFGATSQSYYYKLESLAENDDESVRDCYVLRAVTPTGDNLDFWGAKEPRYLNSGAPSGFNGCFVLGNGDKLGTDVKYGGVWEVEYVADKGFTLKNKAVGGYFAGPTSRPEGTDPIYWNFCTLKETTVVNPIEVGSYDATDANTTAFAGFKTIAGDATWDAETKVFTKTCGWQWDGEGLDLSAYRYIVITAGSSREEAGDGYMTIKDKNGVVVGGDDYGEGYQNMWFSTWNHLFCCKIDLEKLRQEKMFDIRHITELTIDGGSYFMLGTAYATNKEPQVRNRWGQNEEGSVRIMGLTAEKFGTICLPYQAAVACAKIYEIAGKGENYISLVEHDGLLEAGKAYFYCTTKNTSDAATENKVFFYQAIDATVDAPVENNGLIGTFDAIEKVAEGSVVLNGNKLYTVDSDVALAANKAYIDLTKISGDASRGTVTLNFDETTGIEIVKSAKSENGIFNLNGQRLAQPKKGLNIIGGKKVMMK